MKRLREITAILGIVGALFGGQENIAEAKEPDKKGAIQEITKRKVKITLEELRNERIMNKKSAEAELTVLQEQALAVFLREETNDAKTDDKGLASNFSIRTREITQRQVLNEKQEEDKNNRRESRLVDFAFTNFDVKRYQGSDSPWYKADLVVYCSLDDGRVKRMYLSAEKYLPERYSINQDGRLQVVDYHTTDFFLDSFALSKAREICGFKSI